LRFKGGRSTSIDASDESTTRTNLSNASASARLPDEKQKFTGVILANRGIKAGEIRPFLIASIQAHLKKSFIGDGFIIN